MKTFVVVIQTSGSKFKVMHFQGASIDRLYPRTSPFGVVVAKFESNEQNDEYCYQMANQYNSQQ